MGAADRTAEHRGHGHGPRHQGVRELERRNPGRALARAGRGQPAPTESSWAVRQDRLRERDVGAKHSAVLRGSGT